MKSRLPYRPGTHEQQGSKQKAVYIMELFPSEFSMKQCTLCPNLYPATPEFFSRDRSHKDGFRSYCKTCEKSRSKEYRDTHKEQGRMASKNYQEAHKEEIAAYHKKYMQDEGRKEARKEYLAQYYQEHIQEISEQHRQYYLDHQEETCERQGLYLRTEQGRMVSRAHKHRRKAQKKASEGSYTSQQLQEQFQRQKGKCYYCKKKLAQGWHADHVTPLSKGGSNTIENIVIACQTCNLHKSAKLPHEWLENGRLF